MIKKMFDILAEEKKDLPEEDTVSDFTKGLYRDLVKYVTGDLIIPKRILKFLQDTGKLNQSEDEIKFKTDYYRYGKAWNTFEHLLSLEGSVRVEDLQEELDVSEIIYTLDKMIEFFSSREEYEKCGTLLNFQNTLKK